MADEEQKGGAPAAVESPPLGPEDRTIIRPADEGEESTPSKPQHQPPYMVVVDGPRMGARFSLS
ncbi:MAG TPA: hypothetical protein PLZ86_06855, partial [bacterium]|nr:hypothetical protein [bacterium]